MTGSCGDGVCDIVGGCSGACGPMVSPAVVPASYDFNSLICPSRTKAAFEHKRQFPQLSSRAASRACRARRATRSASGWPATSLRPSTISTGTTLRGSSNAPFRLGSYPSGNATRSLKSDAARTVTPEPHHESRAKGFPHRMGRVLARFDRNVETHRQARPFGTHLGNMTKGRSRRAAERKVYHATFGSLAWVRN